jgi:hypothetical protein
MTRPGPLAAVRAALVGGSLGGLTCALLLRDLGVESRSSNVRRRR